MPTFRYNFHKGDPPGDQGQSWMTYEDWEKFNAYVEKLKRTGEFGLPDYIDVTYPEGAFKAFELTEEQKKKPMFSNFGIIIPKGSGDK